MFLTVLAIIVRLAVRGAFQIWFVQNVLQLTTFSPTADANLSPQTVWRLMKTDHAQNVNTDTRQCSVLALNVLQT